MKRFSEQFNKKANSIRLRAAERADLRERLVSYMEYHPLPKTVIKKTANVPELVSEPYRAIKFNFSYISSFMGAIATLVLIVVPVVAEQAVPGDVLYPVKVRFNEEVRSTLSLSPYAKVEWETERLERRLAEARLLADEGKLTEEIEAEVAQAVQAHSDAAQKNIATMRESDSDEAALAEISFASALEVQSEVLESRVADAHEVGRSVAALAGVVAQARNSVGVSQEAANPSFEKLVARLEIETTRAQELFTTIKLSASTEEVGHTERRFADIKRKTDEAFALYGSQSSTNTQIMMQSATTGAAEIEPATELVAAVTAEQAAKELLKAALSDTRKLISFMTDIDVRNSVTIDKLVPLTLTPEEKHLQASDTLEVLQNRAAMLERTEPYADKAEKFMVGMEAFTLALNNSLAAYAAADYDTVATLAAEANLIANDLLLLGSTTPEKVIEVEDLDKATTSEAVEEELTEEGEI